MFTLQPRETRVSTAAEPAALVVADVPPERSTTPLDSPNQARFVRVLLTDADVRAVVTARMLVIFVDPEMFKVVRLVNPVRSILNPLKPIFPLTKLVRLDSWPVRSNVVSDVRPWPLKDVSWPDSDEKDTVAAAGSSTPTNERHPVKPTIAHSIPSHSDPTLPLCASINTLESEA